MKFLADMGIPRKTIEYLHQKGHDAFHLHDQGLDTLTDTEILAKARYENRIVLTHDLDFGELIAASKEHCPTVIIFRLKNMRPEQVERYLSEILFKYQDVLAKGCVLSVTEKNIRVRILPIISNRTQE